MFKKYLSVFLAALLVFAAALPAFALVDADPKFDTPAGYNGNDYQKLVSFLETEDENGAKNGEKISPVYDPADPETWHDPEGYENNTYFEEFDGEKRIKIVLWNDLDLVGELDVSDCVHLQVLQCGWNRLTMLNVSGCAELSQLQCHENQLTELDVSTNAILEEFSCQSNGLTELDVSSNPYLYTFDCSGNLLSELDVSSNSALHTLACYGNELTALDVSGCPWIEQLACGDNPLTELDLSNNTELYNLNCCGTLLTELDLSAVPGLHFQIISSEGNGTVGLSSTFVFTPTFTYRHSAVAEPSDGAEFLGWFTEDDELISSSLTLSETETTAVRVVARFTGGTSVIPGDMNGDGDVTVADALFVLRAAMGLIEITPEQTAAGDVSGDGVVTVADAVLVLRAAMDLITLD